MPREDYFNVNLNKVVSGIGNKWNAQDDLTIAKRLATIAANKAKN